MTQQLVLFDIDGTLVLTGGAGKDVFDVFSRSAERALNGSAYREW